LQAGFVTMKAVNAVLTLAVFVLAATASAPALAWHHGGHTHFGVFIGGPGYWYSPYYYPPYYPAYPYPPLVVAPSSPPTYIEQGDGAPEAAPSQPPSQPQSATPSPSEPYWWYYCAEAKAYYPYINTCPTGWQRVAPQPQR
jgi:hypothetical protein